MQFLALTRRKTEQFDDSQFQPLAEAESQQVRKLYTEGVIRQIWRRDDIKGACLMLEVASEDEAKAAFNSLPLAQAGMLELMNLVPLMPYHGFAPR